jgi:hypothetical protein
MRFIILRFKKGERLMENLVINGKTSIPSDEVIIKAVQFFSTEKFVPTSRDGRIATFSGRPPIPWFMMLLTILGFFLCLLPGIIMYFIVIRKMLRFVQIVITANPVANGTEVIISYPKSAEKMANRFLAALQ